MKRLVLIAILLIVVLAACDDDTPEIALAHHIESETIPIFSLDYPEAWVAEAKDNRIRITNSLFLLRADDPSNVVFSKGQYWLTGNIQPADEVDVFKPAMPEGTTGTQIIIAQFMTTLTPESEPILNESRDFEENGLKGTMTTLTVVSGGRATGVMVVAVEVGEYYGVFMGISHSEEVEQLEDFIRPIIGSLMIADEV